MVREAEVIAPIGTGCEIGAGGCGGCELRAAVLRWRRGGGCGGVAGGVTGGAPFEELMERTSAAPQPVSTELAATAAKPWRS